MSSYETRELSGSLFKNDQKREGKQDADYQGTCKIGGVEFYISAWINKSKSGATYMGLKFKEKEARQPVKKATDAIVDAQPEFDDQIPF